MRTRRARQVWTVVCFLTCTAVTALGQLYTGSIAGTVRDPSGAVVPNANITVTDVSRGTSTSAVTNGSGLYSVRDLPPATYTVRVQVAGFATFERPNVVLDVGGAVNVDVSLQVATAGQTVTVAESNAPMLQTEDAVTGQTLNRTFINDLPLINRQIFDLAFVAPGVSQAPNSAYGVGSASGNNFVSDGSRNAQSDILIDGVSTTNYEQNSGFVVPLYTPSVDAVQEFRIQQTNFSAEFGFTGGTVINVVTRSGANQFHGSLYEFFRNTDLNANGFFNNLNGQPISAYHRNDYGGTAGGPIKKDKLFFFFDYEGTRQVYPSSFTLGLPDAAERSGNFGELCGDKGGTFNSAGLCSVQAGQLWDPYTAITNAQGTTGGIRQSFIPFNNIANYASPNTDGASWILPGVKGDLISPVAQKIMSYLPQPNIGVANIGTPAYNPYDNWFGTAGNFSVSNQFDAKIDSRLTDNDQLSIRLSHVWGNNLNANVLGSVMDANTQGPTNDKSYSSALNYTHTFNPTTLLTASVGYTHSWSFSRGVGASYPGFDPVTALGLPSYIDTAGTHNPPAIALTQYGSEDGGNANFGGQPWSITAYGSDVYQMIASVAHTAGNHDLRVGGEFRVHRINFTQYGPSNGLFSFQQLGTSLENSVGGDAMASFLIGFPTGWSAYQVPPSPATQNLQYSGFIQDNWHVNSRLTLNLGLRYDVDKPRTERFNNMTYFDPSAPSPIQQTGLVPAGYDVKGSFEYTGFQGNPRTPYDTYYGAIGPRFGFAYRIGQNTTVRGGYGIYYDPSKGGAAGIGSGQGGFLGTNAQTTMTEFSNSNNALPNTWLGNPFPGGPGKPIGTSQGDLLGILEGGDGGSAPIRNFAVLPQEQSWSFGLEHQLPGNILIDAEYIGRKGTHLYFGGDTYALDALPPNIARAMIANPALYNSYVPIPIGPAARAATPPYSNPLWNGTWPMYDNYLPYPQYPLGIWGATGLQSVDPPYANSIYNGFQLRIEKRFSRGLQFLMTYTKQKSIDDSSAAGSNEYVDSNASSLVQVQDPNNLRLERSLSEFDISQIVQFSFVYQLPFGRNKAFGGNWNGFVDAIFGGWQANGIYRWDTGLPLILYLTGGTSLPTYGPQRPDLTGTLTKSPGYNIYQYFADPQVAVAPPIYVDGNAPRTLPNLRAPGTNNVTASIFKQFPLGWREGSSLEFRAEAFNLFNRVQFAAPNTYVNGGTFGVITSQANSPRELQLALKLYF